MTEKKLEEITGKICDRYCIYQRIFSREEEQEMLDEVCNKCPMNGLFELLDDINQNKRQEQAPALRLGDKVWIIIEDEEEPNGYIIEENKVNEVGAKGLFVSTSFPPGDDFGSYILYEQIGKTVFFDKQGAEKCVGDDAHIVPINSEEVKSDG